MAKLLETALVKRPHQTFNFTPDQLQEFARCADQVTGPRYFLEHYFYVQHPMKGKLLYAPFPYQDRLIDAYHQRRKVIAMLPRQSGKCLSPGINITVRNKQGEIYVIPIGVFYAYERAKRDGTEPPDISSFQQKEL